MLNYHFVWKIWIEILNWWGCQWVTPESIVRLLNWWNGWKFKKGELQIWKALPCTVLWSVWQHRNDIIFNGAQPAYMALVDLIKTRVAIWMKNHSLGKFYYVHDFVDNLQQVRNSIGLGR